eukprot:scaffold172840_cov56-Cyclotella_meneghiniana.AAC.1
MSKICVPRKFRFSKVSGYIYLRIALTSPIATLLEQSIHFAAVAGTNRILRIMINMSKDTTYYQ